MENKYEKYEGLIFDPIKRKKITGRILVEAGIIKDIVKMKTTSKDIFLPGFVDSHVHIESSMLTPQHFSKIAVRHGTIAVVADPHEIANVAGVNGINYFISDAKRARIKIFFGAPSCVPASPVDDCFQPIGAIEVKKLLRKKDIHFLSEVMNYPGVISYQKDIIDKIEYAHTIGKPVDGHAPGLTSGDLKIYAAMGITTDHECYSLNEALEKINLGMKILIREGSTAKNFNTLHPLLRHHFGECMFCTDDCHPDDLIAGHINLSVKKALMLGYDVFNILQVATVNPVMHYKLNLGLLQIGDPADFITVNNLQELAVKATIIGGVNVLKETTEKRTAVVKNKIKYAFPKVFDKRKLSVKRTKMRLNVIEIVPGELITKKHEFTIKDSVKKIKSNIKDDILKLVIINRYKEEQVFVGFIKGFGLKSGAFASSIAHDSHHILAAGVNDQDLDAAIQYILKNRGGLSFSASNKVTGIKLPVYGLISDKKAEDVAKKYKQLLARGKENGVKVESPFMTLSFMALTVIPELKISPIGLFDVNSFKHVPLFTS